MFAKSQIGKMAAQLHMSGRENLVAIRAYLDGSGKSHEKRLTLAAFAAPDELWEPMEYAWGSVLAEHPLKPQYIHMKELCSLNGEFARSKGWTQEEAFGLINKMLMFLQMFNKQDFNMFYCTIDLDARAKLIREGYTIPKAMDICNGFCSETIMKVHLKKAIDKNEHARFNDLDELLFFFDRGEEFFHPFYKKWESENKRARKEKASNPWVCVTQVAATSNMRILPGLQAADLLAWAVNREHTVSEGVAGKYHAHFMRQVIVNTGLILMKQCCVSYMGGSFIHDGARKLRCGNEEDSFCFQGGIAAYVGSGESG